MDDVDVRSEEFTDDSSRALALGHSASGAGGGINRYVVEQRAATEAEEKRRRNDRRDLERKIRDHNREHPEEPWAMPKEETSVNAEVYEDIEERIRELQAEGLRYFEATAQARAEFEERRHQPGPKPCTGDESCTCGKCNAVTPATLQREGLEVKGGSKSGGKMKRGKKAGGAGIVLTAVSSGSRRSEVERARIALEQNNARLVHEGKHVGRPLKGKERRIRFEGRLEPSTIVELNDWTGKGTAELLEEFHALLLMARTGAERHEIMGRLDGLLVEMAKTA
jgi:hypothetical protein